ncbi:Nucleotide-binding universal stress protein, UspA family [Marinobacter sp. es.048]|uniref:universal stress protein n=1 Tax=Marinobacter sp. es.048 TaxID=1761795 RepID=UPI000B58D2BE|nr:universal stress protein [Marinobacter sp. es.048]SNC62688.1 Nucleotide-binding universal stress protein, UspA family [Marinobacter sp. es.048]
MKSILVPFDGSKSAKRAVDYVLTLRKEGLRCGAVHLVNVQPEPTLFGDYASQSLLGELNSAAKQHSESINAEAMEILKADGIDCKSHGMIGDIATAVGSAVERYGCDTIIMGTRGMSNLANLVMGSVATRVLHEAAVPVVLVK